MEYSLNRIIKYRKRLILFHLQLLEEVLTMLTDRISSSSSSCKKKMTNSIFGMRIASNQTITKEILRIK